MRRTYREDLYFGTMRFDDHRYRNGEFICSITIPHESGIVYTLDVFKCIDHTDDWGNYIPIVDIKLMGSDYRLDGPLDIPWGTGNLRLQVGWDIEEQTLTEIEIFVESAPIPIEVDEKEDC